jgi:hypothetical protein
VVESRRRGVENLDCTNRSTDRLEGADYLGVGVSLVDAEVLVPTSGSDRLAPTLG